MHNFPSSNQPAKWSATGRLSAPRYFCSPATQRVSASLGVTIDNPPIMATLEDKSSVGRAVCALSEGRKIPVDAAVDLIEQGFDIASLSRSYE